MARIQTLHKGDKDDYSMPGRYRPISLLPVMGKLLETILSRRLSRFLEIRNPHAPYQFCLELGGR